jgi:chromate reductase
MLSASIGMLGGARAQYHLRQVAVYLDVIPLNKPEVFVARAGEKFDQSLKLTDEATRKSLQALIEALVAHHARLSGRGRP